MENVSDTAKAQVADCSARERKKREARERMHLAALELVAESGLAAVTVDQIAERAGVSARTLFNYWGTKEAVVLGTVPGDTDRLVDCLRERPVGEDPSASVRAVLTEHLRHATPDRSVRTLKRTVLRREPQLAQLFFNHTNDVQRTLIALLTERLTDTLGPDLAADAAAMHVFWLFAMSRASYAVSMRRGIDLLDALDLVLGHVDAGRVSLGSPPPSTPQHPSPQHPSLPQPASPLRSHP